MARTVRIHAKDARAIALGHPWVWRQAVAERPKGARPGDVVDVASDDRPFLGRGIWDPDASVPVRIWTRDDTVRLDAALIERRVRQAAALRDAAAVPARTDAFRIVNAEGDRLPGIVVERWGDFASVTLQTAALRPWEDRIVAAVQAAAAPRGIYVRGDDASRLAAGEPAPAEFTVREPSGIYEVQLGRPGKPGLFTDMREVRALFAPMLRGRSFLNLFAHTGAFSGAAAAAGAAEIVSVDLSPQFLEVAERNVRANAPAAAPPRHERVSGDVFEALRRFASQGRTFGAVLADPPTFSSSKESGAFNVKDDYRRLVRMCLRVLEPGGLLLAATNWRGADRENFVRLIHDAAEMERRDVRLLAALGQPADYPSLPLVPETRHLEAALCAVSD
ncbi:MAG: Ribosomal RNA large subunit methyltransferase I [Planctomycetes bacterium]|nr:Ribosomal RNA large subunit methyltransferase I [Planctomycetota bacterium]